MQLRLMTYNIHKGIGGVDRRYRLERIVETIRHVDPDVVMLQEVDDGVPRSRLDRQVDRISDAVSLPHRAFQRNVKLRQGHYGNAILSRYSLTDVHHVDLSVPMKKRRRALGAHVHLQQAGHRRTVKLYNAHLGLASYERSIQVKRLLSDNDLTHSRASTPVIIGGDFNDVWGAIPWRFFLPAGYQSAGKNILTFPAVRPLRPLDRIFFRGEILLDHCYAGHTKLARQASYHRPLVALFEVPIE